MKHFHIWTIGCQMNRADSEFMANYLEWAGLTKTESINDADLILLNSCVVREHAELKVINKLTSLKGLKKRRPNIVIALTGCMVDSDIKALSERFPWVDLFFRPQEWDVLSQWAEDNRLPGLPQSEVLLPEHTPVSAYVPVIHGCDHFCSYCIVPYRRGTARSRGIDEICCQVQRLAQRGTKEIILLGQIVDAYGYDLPSRPDLADLLTKLNEIEGIVRIRFLTSHPGYMDHKLIQAIARLDKVCEHISLPLQAGDDEILKAMNRGYTAGEYANLIDQIRRNIPGVAISTDIIVGFPGETDKQFCKTMEMLQRIRFDKVHVAAYSPRPGTAAAKMLQDNIPPEQKELRRAQVEALQKTIAAEINAASVGRVVEVLVEGQEKGKWYGRTRGDKLVFFTSTADMVGQLVKVKIEKASPFALQGVLEGSVQPSSHLGVGLGSGSEAPAKNRTTSV